MLSLRQGVESYMRHISPDFLVAMVVLAAAFALHSRVLIVVGAIGLTFAAIRMAVNYLSTPNA